MAHGYGYRDWFSDSLFAECADQFALRQDMTFHRFEQFAFIRAGEQAHCLVERVEFEKVTMRSARRAGPAVADDPRRIFSNEWTALSLRQILAGHRQIFGESPHVGGDVVQHPMHPRAAGRIGIVHDERERLRAGGRFAPCKRGRNIFSNT